MRSRLSRLLVPLTVAGLAATASVPAWGAVQSAPATTAKTLTIYVAPVNKGGSDTKHTGLTASSPILTLQHAQQVAEDQKPQGNVVVRIEQGTYLAAITTWYFYVPGHTISFMPSNYVLGHGRPANGDPLFEDVPDGNGKNPNTWFHAQLPGPGSSLHNGGNVGLRFYYLQIENYTQGISLDGQTGHGYHNNANPPMYTRPSAGLNDVDISGMTFNRIGDMYAPGYTGYGVILFTDSSGDAIVNNTFNEINNTVPVNGPTDELHALYITHFSSDNTISKNLFKDTNGEAVKIRDRSNGNWVEDNTFINTGGVAAYLDDYCNSACSAATLKKPPVAYRQCASYDNHLVDNTIESNNTSDLIPLGETNAGGAPCSIPKGQQRLYASGNKR